MDILHCEREEGNLPQTPLAQKLLEIYERELYPYRDLKLERIGVGRKFFYLLSDRGQLGLSFVYEGNVLPSRLLKKRFLWDLLEEAWRGQIQTSAALAAANAIFQAFLEKNPDFVDFGGDFVAEVEKGCPPGANIDFVGFVEGIVKTLKGKGYRITLYEDNPIHRLEASKVGINALNGCYLSVLNRGGCLITTGSAWIDPRVYLTLREKNFKFTAVVGPTSSFHPKVLFDFGVELVGGSYIPSETRGEVLRLVEAGFGFRKLKGLVKKWTAKRG